MTSTFFSWSHYLLEGFWNKYGDPRVIDYPFMSSIRVPAFILTSYLLFVLVLGPRWMRHRKPFSLKPILLVYNTTMAIYNGSLFFRLCAHPFDLYEKATDTKFPPFTDTSDFALNLIFEVYLYTISKYVDLLDTVFFVLRKKDSQITGLHLYHHFSVALHGWIVFRMCAICNCCAIFVFMNTGIHLLMYSYYALAALGPTLRPYLWWKRYITQIQIGQFIILFIHSIYFIFTQEGYALYYTFNYIFNSVVYFYLFTKFYMQTYSTRKNVAIEEKLKSQ